MKVGKLDRIITFESPVRENRSNGERKTTSYKPEKRAWAEVRPANAREIITAERVGQVVTHTVTVRYDSAVQSDWLIDMGGRKLAIVGIEDHGRRESLVMTCKEMKR